MTFQSPNLHQNHFTAPEYTQIPNVVFDYWMRRLKPATGYVLMSLCRKIFGWHKTTDYISKNQLMECTGLSKNTVQAALTDLENHGLLYVHKSCDERGHKPNGYRLNIFKPIDEMYVDPALSSQTLVVPRSNGDPGVGQELTQGVGQNLTPQKKDLTKERLTKEIKTEIGGGKNPTARPKKEPDKLDKKSYGDEGKVLLTEDEHTKLLDKMTAAERDDLIEAVEIEMGKNEKAFNKKYSSHYHTILSWHRLRKSKPTPFKGSQSAFHKPAIDRRTKTMNGDPVEVEALF